MASTPVSTTPPVAQGIIPRFVGEDEFDRKTNLEWTVRPATLEDREKVNQLLEASFSTILPQYYDEDTLAKGLLIITRVPDDLLTCGTWFVVEHPTRYEIVGCGGWTPVKAHGVDSQRRSPSSNSLSSSSSSSSPHLRRVATSPDWIRRGVGKAILDKIRQDVSEKVGPLASIEVFSTLSAVRFYAKAGFVPIENVDVPVAPDCSFHCVLMRWTPDIEHSSSCVVGLRPTEDFMD